MGKGVGLPPRPRVLMLQALFVVVAVTLPSCLYTASCPDGEGLCSGGERTAAWLGGPVERLLYKVSNECQQDIILPSIEQGIFISVKTTVKYHSTRLPSILYTWLQTVSPSQVHLVTDREIHEKGIWLDIAKENGFRVSHADCTTGYHRNNLCCKSGVEFRQYYTESRKHRWYCHFDDDVYVNIPALLSSLAPHDPLQQKVYIGRWPLAAEHLAVPQTQFPEGYPIPVRDTYRYATGAAFCISASLMEELEDYLSGPIKFAAGCDQLRLPDDMLIGCVIGAVLGYNLTNDSFFTTQLNSIRSIPPARLKDQVTVSYGSWTIRQNGEQVKVSNKLEIPNAVFTEEEDPTRFFSYHCLLYPKTRWCVADG